MSYNYTLKYRTFDQLLSDIQVDFQNLSLQNMIEPQQLIKVARRVNYDLGLRIMMTKEVLLDVEKNQVKLPDDFFVLNFALICDEFSVTQAVPQGTWIEERYIPPYKETQAFIDPCTPPRVNCQRCQPHDCSCDCETPVVPAACSAEPYNPLVPYGDSCVRPRVFLNCKNESYELIQRINSQTNVYKVLLPIRILQNNQNIECCCPNLYMNSGVTASIQNGFLRTSFKTGKIYINYQGALEDDDGNLLIPDHDLLNEYYEYAVKQRILENLVMNNEPVDKQLQIVEVRLRAARNNALSMVNTPNFSEMREVWRMNRRAMYARYYDMFKSYPWFVWDGNPNSYINERPIR